jgi:hypothetical protein
MPWFQGTVTYYFMSLFLSSRFSFSGVLLFRMGSWPAVKRVIHPVIYMTGSCTLWEIQSLRFTWCLSFSKISLLFMFQQLYSSLVTNRQKQGNTRPWYPLNLEVLDIY